ncbi:nickel pincer cofactor biosynthesis protein LarC, partial [bacterium]|nr:nickel pincer cofactor biosynthesis protein LarC [candidate division CSSED10-310 bacterium]
MVFRRLAEAEGAVHGIAPEEVHFHEVGAVDAIVDIVGTVVGLHWLQVDEIVCSPVHVGTGFVDCAHGRMPVPAPATARLLQGVPVFSTGIRSELTTPTGAAILTTLADRFAALPMMTITTVGYGGGTRDLEQLPNLLRLFVGEKADDAGRDRVMVMEANIDDMNPELYPALQEALFAAGALDVAVLPLQMKKGRPGFQVQVIAPPPAVSTVSNAMFAHSTTLGIRLGEVNRIILRRRADVVSTAYGEIQVKCVQLPNGVRRCTPEHDSCQAAARRGGVSLVEVYQAVQVALAEDSGEG